MHLISYTENVRTYLQNKSLIFLKIAIIPEVKFDWIFADLLWLRCRWISEHSCRLWGPPEVLQWGVAKTSKKFAEITLGMTWESAPKTFLDNVCDERSGTAKALCHVLIDKSICTRCSECASRHPTSVKYRPNKLNQFNSVQGKFFEICQQGYCATLTWAAEFWEMELFFQRLIMNDWQVSLVPFCLFAPMSLLGVLFLGCLLWPQLFQHFVLSVGDHIFERQSDECPEWSYHGTQQNISFWQKFIAILQVTVDLLRGVPYVLSMPFVLLAPDSPQLLSQQLLRMFILNWPILTPHKNTPQLRTLWNSQVTLLWYLLCRTILLRMFLPFWDWNTIYFNFTCTLLLNTLWMVFLTRWNSTWSTGVPKMNYWWLAYYSRKATRKMHYWLEYVKNCQNWQSIKP